MLALISAVVAVAAAMAAFLQVYTNRAIAHGQLVKSVLDHIYSKEYRADRASLYRLATVDFHEWTDDQFASAERVGVFFNRVGFLMKNGYLPKKDFLDYWGEVIIRCYQIMRPLVEFRRKRENLPLNYIYFEWVAREAIANERTVPWWKSRWWRARIEKTEDRLLSMPEPRLFELRGYKPHASESSPSEQAATEKAEPVSED